MAAVQISEVVESIYVFASGAPEALLVSAWRNAARKFFRDTRAWRADPTIAVGATTGEYTLTSPYADSEVVDLSTDPEMDGRALRKATLEQAQSRGYIGTGAPAAFRIGAPGTMILMPAPTSDVTPQLSVVRAVLMPTRDAETIDDSMMKYFDIIEFGALEYVFRVPGKSWSDLAQSNGYRALFQEEIDKHTSHGDAGDMRNVPRTVRYGGY